jgi:hypothetical protein
MGSSEPLQRKGRPKGTTDPAIPNTWPEWPPWQVCARTVIEDGRRVPWRKRGEMEGLVAVLRRSVYSYAAAIGSAQRDIGTHFADGRALEAIASALWEVHHSERGGARRRPCGGCISGQDRGRAVRARDRRSKQSAWCQDGETINQLAW